MMAKVINLAERREQKIQKQLHSPMQGWIVWLKCPKCETREYSELRMPEAGSTSAEPWLRSMKWKSISVPS